MKPVTIRELLIEVAAYVMAQEPPASFSLIFQYGFFVRMPGTLTDSEVEALWIRAPFINHVNDDDYDSHY